MIKGSANGLTGASIRRGTVTLLRLSPEGGFMHAAPLLLRFDLIFDEQKGDYAINCLHNRPLR